MDEVPARHGPYLRGQIFVARFAFVREAWGARGVELVLQALPEDDRRWLSGVDLETWYPFAALGRLDRTIARVLAPGEDDIYERMGYASAQHRSEWLGEHARLVNVHGFLKRVAEDHHHFHTFGSVSYQRTGFSEGRISYAGYPETDPIYCLSARGFFRGAIDQLTGGRTQVDEVECQCRGGSACVFVLQWRVTDGMTPGLDCPPAAPPGNPGRSVRPPA